jgi:hypothetical protein
MNQIGLEGILALYEQKGRAGLAWPFLCAHNVTWQENSIFLILKQSAELFYK